MLNLLFSLPLSPSLPLPFSLRLVAQCSELYNDVWLLFSTYNILRIAGER